MYHRWHKFAKTMYVVEVSNQVVVQSDLDHKSEFTSYSVNTRIAACWVWFQCLAEMEQMPRVVLLSAFQGITPFFPSCLRPPQTPHAHYTGITPPPNSLSTERILRVRFRVLRIFDNDCRAAACNRCQNDKETVQRRYLDHFLRLSLEVVLVQARSPRMAWLVINPIIIAWHLSIELNRPIGS